jgi:hypothetical protein
MTDALLRMTAIVEEPLVSYRVASAVPVKAWAFRPTKLASNNHGFSRGSLRPVTARKSCN